MADAVTLDAVQNVLIVASSSRSGSTLLVELLKRLPGYLHLSGEINPFLRIVGLTWPTSGTDSDALVADLVPADAMRRLRADIACEIGIPQMDSSLSLTDGLFVERLHRRLRMQWPQEDIDLATVTSAAHRAAHRVRRELCNGQSWITQLHAHLLIELRERFPAINPYYYDLDRALLGSLAPQIPIPSGPPGPQILEEPPFVLTVPTRPPQSSDFARRTLVIKAPSNAYRLGFIRALFPSAQLRILHLTRNPAAAINGLYDGWHHAGFHSHRIGAALQLRDFAPSVAADRQWWKFDLPPGWRNYCTCSVEEVCAFQWRSAHNEIDRYVQATGVEHLRLRFEDLLTGFSRSPAQLNTLREWLGDPLFPETLPPSLPTTMATRPPGPKRWLQRAEKLRPVLALPATQQCIERLNYGDETWWI